ncbi:MAG TPA: hypothetical protein VFK33_12415 [Bacillales bacterium]|nr:hypothetical protein [Bacillales bacterium]
MGNVIVAAVALIVVLIVVFRIVKGIRAKAPDFSKELPQRMGFRHQMMLEPLVDRLENALDDRYMESVKQRVLTNGSIRENEYDWYLLEMKRFFLMTAVLNYVPMYSDKLDDIWHEMIMFTREYETFCENFLGEMIHHEPNIQREADPEQRAWFEWCYSRLFDLNRETEAVYGEFFHHPLSKDRIADFRDKPDDDLIQKYFRMHIQIEAPRPVMLAVIRETQQQIKDSETEKLTPTFTRGEENLGILALYMLYFSIFSADHDTYAANMNQVADGHSFDGGGFGHHSSCGSNCGSSCGGRCGGA